MHPLPTRRAENGTFDKLLDSCTPQHALDELLLAPATLDALQQVIDEHVHAVALKAAGVTPTVRMLFDGAPGTGKTSAAGAIARALNRHLFVVRESQLIGGFMGDSQRHLGEVFDYARTQPGVFLFDEFDGIATKRGGDNNGLDREYNRVITSMLTLLERHVGPSIVIAATNRPEIIDAALVRRFDVAVSFPMPTPAIDLTLVCRSLGYVSGAAKVSTPAPRAADEGPPWRYHIPTALDTELGAPGTVSHADIVRICAARRRREMISAIKERAARDAAQRSIPGVA